MEVARDLAIRPPFRLRHKIWHGHIVCLLLGRVSRHIAHVTSTSIHSCAHFMKIMTTILQEANAGAFTTKGQAIDRRDELFEIGQRGFLQASPEAAFLFSNLRGAAAGTAGRRKAAKQR